MSISINKLDTAGEWMVGTNHIYIPKSGIKVEHENVAGSESGRTEDGVMHIDWVRRDVRKVSLEWDVMTAEELTNIINWMQGQEFTFTFKDQGVVKSMSAYCGQCSYNFLTADYMGLGISLYTDVSINVIEM